MGGAGPCPSKTSSASASLRVDVLAVWILAVIADAPWVAPVDAWDPQALAGPQAAFGRVEVDPGRP